MENFPLTDEQCKTALQAFIDSIDPNDVCKLASQHNSSRPCRIFRDHAHGSYNVCYFVEFEDSTKWVVRFPLVPCISNVWDKVQSEVATVRYLEANTTIPVPHIHAFGRGGAADEKNPTGHTYIVQSYIVGQPLNLVDFRLGGLPRRERFYSQLVDILAQLRQQEFPYAGSLMPDPDGGTTPRVGPLLSIQLNDLQRENPSLSIQPTKFATPLDYAYDQYRLLDESLRLPPEKLSRQVAELEVFALEDLKNRLPSIVENQYPFVLTHTDLRPTNIIVDENMQIQGIIDWEWARTVPRQFFLPPTWVAGCPPDMVSGVEFRIEYRWLRDVLWADTSEHCRQLASEWNRKLPRRIDMSLAVIFGHHSSFVNAYYRGVFPMFYESSWEQEVKQFYECDGPDGKFSLDVQQRLRESERYAQYLERLGARPASLAEESRQESGEPPIPDPGDS